MAGEDGIITRVSVETLEDDLLKYKYGGGFYFEYDVGSLRDIAPICGERCQTLTYYGLEELKIRAFFYGLRAQGRRPGRADGQVHGLFADLGRAGPDPGDEQARSLWLSHMPRCEPMTIKLPYELHGNSVDWPE